MGRLRAIALAALTHVLENWLEIVTAWSRRAGTFEQIGTSRRVDQFGHDMAPGSMRPSFARLGKYCACDGCKQLRGRAAWARRATRTGTPESEELH